MTAEKDTRTRLVEAAAWLIHRNGYHGTGLSDILSRSGAPKGVLYYHFPGGKPELGVAALDLTTRIFDHQIRRASHRTRTIKAFLRAMAELTKQDLISSSFRAGCPLTTTALETAPEDPDLTAACRDGFDRWISTTAEIFQRLGQPRKKAQYFAEHTMASLEGALAIARTRKDTTIIDVTTEGLIRLIEAESS